MDLVKVNRSELEAGSSLRFPLYNQAGMLILNTGIRLPTGEAFDRLLARELYRSPDDAVLSGHSRPASPTDLGVVSVSALKAAETEARQAELKASLMDSLPGRNAEVTDAQLKPGTILQVQLEGAEEKWNVVVLGGRKGKSLMATIPDNNAVLPASEGRLIIGRAFSGKVAYAFQARILKACHDPFPYLHLEYPSVMKCVPIRKAVRVPVSIPCHLKSKAKVLTVPATIEDISVGGARVSLACAELAVGDVLAISFSLNRDDLNEGLELEAVVRAAPTGHLGLEFVNVDRKTSLVLKSVLYLHMDA